MTAVDRQYELGHEKIGRLLWKYSAPAIVGMLSNSLYNLVDTIFVGWGAGTQALGALAICFPVQLFILAIAQLVGIGAASIYSRNLGAGNQERADRAAGTSFVMVLILSLTLTVFGLMFLKPILRLFGATPGVLPYAVQYMFIIFLGSFFFAYIVSTSNLVRAEGNAKVAMIAMFVGAGMNIILDPIFIFGFGMGIRGAAVATVIANICAFTYLTHYLLRGKSLLNVRVKYLKPDISLLPEMFAIGSSSFLRVVAGSILAIAVNNSLAYYGTDLHLAIWGVINRMFLFVLMPVFGLTHGVMPIIGFNYGAKDFKRTRQALMLGIYYATGICAFGYLFMYFFANVVIRLFGNDPNMIAEGPLVLRILIMGMPFIGLQVISTGLFQSIGKAGIALVLSTSRQVLFLIPLVLILPLFMKLIGIWLAFPLADFLAALVTWLFTMRELGIMNRSIDAGG